MTVVASCVYRHGVRVRDIAIDERIDCPADRSQFVWIGLCDPCVDEIATLQRLYALRPRAIEDEVLAMEARILDAFLERGEIARIVTLRRELIRFQRIFVPMEEAARKLARSELPGIDAEARAYFSDVFDHVRRVETMVDGLRDVLTSVFEFGNLIEQQRTGAITRQLAAWAAILAVPTAIAGIYGMNFDFMPELKTRYGYFVVLGVIAVTCSILYARFRKLGWL